MSMPEIQQIPVQLAALHVRVSNTGKTITVTFPEEWAGRRADVYFYDLDHSLEIVESDNGRMISGRYLSMPAAQMPNWPEHGIIDLDCKSFRSGRFVAQLPSDLPRARPITRRPRPAPVDAANDVENDNSATDLAGPGPKGPIVTPVTTANIVMSINDKAYAFDIPADELLETAMEWTHRGYAT